MKNRFRVEIYDEVKSNDLTIYSEQGIDKEHLVELVYSNMANFDGNVKAFVFDKLISLGRGFFIFSPRPIFPFGPQKLWGPKPRYVKFKIPLDLVMFITMSDLPYLIINYLQCRCVVLYLSQI